MMVYEFGNIENPKLLMFHGRACTWEQNFGQVIDKLKDQFYLIIDAPYFVPFPSWFVKPVSKM